MTDKSSSGQPLKIPARIWNTLVDVAALHQREAELGTGVDASVGSVSGIKVKVKNSSGGPLVRGSFIELSGLLVDELRPDRFWFDGITPTSTTCRFAIVERQLPENAIGDAFVSGVCIARLDVADVTHVRAGPAEDSVIGDTGDGSLQVLYAPATGVQECVVVFRGQGVAADWMRFQIVEATPASRTAIVTPIAIPVGFALADLPEYEDIAPLAIQVCDPSGCWLNEPAGSLVGRQGAARYVLPLETNLCQPTTYDLGPHWEVQWLCCPTPECD